MKYVSVEERISKHIVDKLVKDSNLTGIQIVKIRYGLSILLINLFKMLILYGLAIILHVTKITFITHMAFLAIRTHAYGYHARTSLSCSIISIFLFVLLPMFLTPITLPKDSLVLTMILNFLILNKYAPATTDKNPVENAGKMKKHKVMALIINLLMLTIIILTNNLHVSLLIALGTLMASLLTTPIVYKLLGGI